MMKKSIPILMAVLVLWSCERPVTEDDKAAPLMERIEQLNEACQYQQVLDSIESLRRKYPKAVKARRRALTLWQEASLKIAQDDIGRTDSALQAVAQQMARETDIYRRNMLGVKRDSLQARYEGLIGTVRVIHKKMEEK